jgi:hypothetical protein
VDTLAEYGFAADNYAKVIVSWDWTPGAAKTAKELGVELWSFRTIMQEIVEKFRGTRHYFTDDTMRTLHLFDMATSDQN